MHVDRVVELGVFNQRIVTIKMVVKAQMHLKGALEYILLLALS